MNGESNNEEILTIWAFQDALSRRLLLWINTGLDVLYLAGGLVLLDTMGVQNRFAAGSGWGIIVQGGFLFLLDLLHAVAVPRQEPATDEMA